MESAVSESEQNQRDDAAIEEALTTSLEKMRPLALACHVRMGSPLGPSDLDEAIQEATLAAWKNKDDFRGDSSVETWLYGIARISILEQARRGSRIRYFEGTDTADSPDPADPSPGPGTQADGGVSGVIDQSLKEAGTTVAKICRAKAIDGKSFVQIGRELNVPETRLKARFYRSLPSLRNRLRKLLGDTPDE